MIDQTKNIKTMLLDPVLFSEHASRIRLRSYQVEVIRAGGSAGL